jgi:hypothetical protein
MSSREPGWAELFIPLQTIELKSIHIDEPKRLSGPGIPLYAIDRPIAALSYINSNYKIPTLSILTPFLKIHAWDSTTGRLDLEIDMNSAVAMKCSIIQDHIIELLAAKPQWLYPYTKKKEELIANFQHIIHDHILTIYLHGPNQENKQTGRVWIWKEDTWQKGASVQSFKKGQLIRVALRFQGVCFLQTPAKDMRYRIQHQTVAIFHKIS